MLLKFVHETRKKVFSYKIMLSCTSYIPVLLALKGNVFFLFLCSLRSLSFYFRPRRVRGLVSVCLHTSTHMEEEEQAERTLTVHNRLVFLYKTHTAFHLAKSSSYIPGFMFNCSDRSFGAVIEFHQ